MLLTVFYWPIEFSNTAIIAPETTRSMPQTFSSASSSPLFGRAPPSGSYATHRCLLLFSACIRKFYIACCDIKCSKYFAVPPNEPFYFLHSMLFCRYRPLHGRLSLGSKLLPFPPFSCPSKLPALQKQITGTHNRVPAAVNIFYSTSSSSDVNTSSSKNSNNVMSNPRASMITVLKVTVLFLPFMIQAILPCRMPDFCSNRYCDIFFSASNADTRFATAS